MILLGMECLPLLTHKQYYPWLPVCLNKILNFQWILWEIFHHQLVCWGTIHQIPRYWTSLFQSFRISVQRNPNAKVLDIRISFYIIPLRKINIFFTIIIIIIIINIIINIISIIIIIFIMIIITKSQTKIWSPKSLNCKKNTSWTDSIFLLYLFVSKSNGSKHAKMNLPFNCRLFARQFGRRVRIRRRGEFTLSSLSDDTPRKNFKYEKTGKSAQLPK